MGRRMRQAVMLALSLAWLAHAAGSAVIIGAFAAGLLLNRTPQAKEIERVPRLQLPIAVEASELPGPPFLDHLGVNPPFAKLNVPQDTAVAIGFLPLDAHHLASDLVPQRLPRSRAESLACLAPAANHRSG